MRPSIVDLLEAHGLSIAGTIVPTRSAMYFLAMAAVTLLFLRRAERRAGLPLDVTLPLAAVAGLGALVGARLYFIVDGGTFGSPEIWLGREGQGSWGACIGSSVSAVSYLKLKKEDPWPALDAAASAVMLAIAMARLGCFLDGCDFGTPTSIPWAISYPRGSLAFQAQVSAGVLPAASVRSATVHPLPIYLSLNAVALFLIMSLVWRRWHARPGVTFALLWVLYGGTRFLLEFFRDPAAGGATSGISGLQWTSLGALGFGLALGAVVLRRAREATELPYRRTRTPSVESHCRT